MKRQNLPLLVLIFSAVTAIASFAQPRALFTSVCTTTCPNGLNLQSLIEASDGNFYGVAMESGNFQGGTIFQVTPAGKFTRLFAFQPGANKIFPQGDNPNSLVEGPDGNLYGTTLMGGHDNLQDSGVLFRIAKNGSHFTVIHKFCASSGCPDGNSPNSLIVVPNGTIFGLAGHNMFRYSPSTNTFTPTFASFFPIGGGFGTNEIVLASDGNFYGLTFVSDTQEAIYQITPQGATGVLTVFPNNEFVGSITPTDTGLLAGICGDFNTNSASVCTISLAAGQIQLLSALPGLTAGCSPAAKPLFASDGNLWIPVDDGTGLDCIPSDNGRILKLSLTTGDLLASFPFNGKNGSSPTSLLQTKTGAFAGSTAGGGVVPDGDSSGGVVFTLNAGLKP